MATADRSAEQENDNRLSRRAFLRSAAVTAGSAGIVAATAGRASAELVPPQPDELAEMHAEDPALLIDLTRCVGCGRCVNACKTDNDLQWREDQPATGDDAVLASSNWTVVRAFDAELHDGPAVGARRRGGHRFVKTQCMHCLEPACASACFVKALRKSDAGPVIYDGDKCVGCRYCLMACPFGVPTFEWDETFGRVQKCDMCSERVSQGRPTACAEACPQGAITYGKRRELLAEAWRRIDGSPERYVGHVYGEHEVGGTAVLYVSDVSFEQLGFRTGLTTDTLGSYTWEITRLLPPIAAGLGVTLMTLYLRRRRVLLEAGEAAERIAAEAAEGTDTEVPV